MGEPKEVTPAELEGRRWELLNSHDNSTQGRLESARLLHESIKAREEARRERGEWEGEALDRVACQGCYVEFPLELLRDAPCSECGAACRACAACATCQDEVACDSCVDARLPWFAEYLRRCVAAKLN